MPRSAYQKSEAVPNVVTEAQSVARQMPEKSPGVQKRFEMAPIKTKRLDGIQNNGPTSKDRNSRASAPVRTRPNSATRVAGERVIVMKVCSQPLNLHS